MTEDTILTLLEQNESLAYEQIALLLDEPPEQVRSALTALRRRRFVDVLGVSEVVGHATAAVAYWRLTELGRGELARLRSR
jgi:predicted ArsR family transcriptional regulator